MLELIAAILKTGYRTDNVGTWLFSAVAPRGTAAKKENVLTQKHFPKPVFETDDRTTGT